MPMLDEAGRDTELARFLHGCGRLDRNTLEGLLIQARQDRPGGGTLARAIVERGLLPQAEVEASLQQVAAGAPYPARPSGSFQAVQPPPSGRYPGSATGRLHPSDAQRLQQSGLAHSLHGPSSAHHRRAKGTGRLGVLGENAVLGHYRVLEPLGAGSMGQVFLAEHIDTGGRYAVKTLLSSANAGYVARFLREGEAQAKVDSHPNVLRVHAMGEVRGMHYLVTEFASGGDLKEVLRKQERLPADGAARLARDLARGLAHMHAHGVLHRDLKPANILFDANGTAKLADFGLARFEGAQSLTMTGELVGTPVYMPPEQALGLRDKVGPPADVYGLAAIIYHCLAGRPPFEGATTIEVVNKLTRETAPALVSLAPETPPELAQLIHAGLAKEPEHRPEPRAWAEALDEFLRSRAPQPQKSEQPQAPQPRPAAAGSPLRLLVGAAVVSLLLAVGVVGFMLTRETTPGAETPIASTLAPEPEVAPEPEPEPVGIHWPLGVERRYRLELETRGEFPAMGMMRWMAKDGIQQKLFMRRSFELTLWADPRSDEESAPAASEPADEGEEDDEGWDDDGWDHDDGEPASAPDVTRLCARIDGFVLDWSALGMKKAFDSRAITQDEDGRRYGAVLGKTFTLGMRRSGEVVWVHGTEAIQQAVYDAVGGVAAAEPDAEDHEHDGDRPRDRDRHRGGGGWGGFESMRARMTYHVPELVGSVMRDTLNVFFFALPGSGEVKDGQTYERTLSAPWSVGSGWGQNTGRSPMSPPDIPCTVKASERRGGGLLLQWTGDNKEQVAAASAKGEVLLARNARGRITVEGGAVRSAELARDSYTGDFRVEGGWDRDEAGQVHHVEGEQEGRLELLE